MSPQLELSAFLDDIRRRWRLLVALRAGASALAGVALVLGALALTFRAARPAPDVLLAMTAVAGLAALAWAVRAMRPTLRPPDDRRLARFIEERHPDFQDALVTAVQVQDGGQAFARAVVSDAAVRARDVVPEAVVRRDEFHRAAGRGAAACALLLVTGGASLAPIERAIDAARVRLFPSRIAIAVEPGDMRVIAGQPVTVRARVTGLPEGFDAAPIVTLQSGTTSRQQPMRRDGGAHLLTLPAVDASFTYRVSSAGVRSSEYKVVVLRRPTLQRIDVAYRYPAYTGIPPRSEEDGGDIYAPAGTRVTVRVRADKPLTAGVLNMGSRALALSPSADPAAREASFTVEREGSYRVDLTDADGLKSGPSSEYFVRVTDDRPPEVRIVRPEGDRQVTPLEEVEIAAQATDDYRLGSLELVYAVGAQPEKVVALSRGAAPSLSGGHLLFLEELNVRPGDMVRAYARAREARKGGREARSEMLLLEVAPFDQQFSLAQSQAGGGGMNGGDLESLIQTQKNILNATWNLLRRAAAGRSDADLHALARAQGELKQRVQSQAGRRPGATVGADPIGQAAGAMARAEEALQRKRLQDAVPHEMEALTQLGRALAENRRREVRQQRGGGGGGGNRSTQDLSALFDRELLRQQQTNYENRQSTSSEERDRNSESDVQKRIRELAQRQDELARAQRELARQQLSEDERRRQLERLTREQEELRREAEQLARDAQRQQSGSQRSQSREQSESLREAADDMRAASGDLRRNDAQSASERGSRAAERLRGADGASAGSSQPQSLGEMQAEAQQLSEAQRRLEQQQQGAAGRQGGADSRKLGEEQARLAERAERLQQSARAAASGRGDQRQRQAAEAAARELQRGRVAERMRENARRLASAQRSGQSQSGQAQTSPQSGQSPERGSSEQGQQPGQSAQPGDSRESPQDGRSPQSGQAQQPGQSGQAGRSQESGQPQASGASPQAGRPEQSSPSQQSGQPGQGGGSSLPATLDRVAERLGAAADGETRRLANELARNRGARERLEETARRLERAQREGDTQAQGELRRELQRAEQMLRDLQRGARADSGLDGTTPEEYERSLSAPGLEAFKQDFSRWEQLKRDITLALERRDLALARQLAGRAGKDKVSAGSVENLPDAYRAKVAKYFEALARAGRRPEEP